MLLLLIACSDFTDREQKITKALANVKHIDMKFVRYKIAKDTIFLITNTGDYPLIIKNVETSCGCTQPVWTKEPIKPGERGEVKVTYDAKYPGRFHKTISVFANVKNSPIELIIAGEVKFNEEEL